MKVTINPNGAMELDVDNGETAAAAAFVAEIQACHSKAVEVESAVAQQHSYAAALASLTNDQRETWETLREFDSPEGVHVSGIAQFLEISDGAAGQRLQVMQRRGLVYRVARGRYRAARPEKGAVDV